MRTQKNRKHIGMQTGNLCVHEISKENKVFVRVQTRGHSYHILAKNLATPCLSPETEER